MNYSNEIHAVKDEKAIYKPKHCRLKILNRTIDVYLPFANGLLHQPIESDSFDLVLVLQKIMLAISHSIRSKSTRSTYRDLQYSHLRNDLSEHV